MFEFFIVALIALALVVLLARLGNEILIRNVDLNIEVTKLREKKARMEMRLFAEINKRKEVEHERDLYAQYLDDAVQSVYKREEENEQKFKAGYSAGKEDAVAEIKETAENKFLILDKMDVTNEVS